MFWASLWNNGRVFQKAVGSLRGKRIREGGEQKAEQRGRKGGEEGQQQEEECGKEEQEEEEEEECIPDFLTSLE